MSGSEGKQTDQLSSREIEEEEMAQELMGVAMYEEGMGYDQMKTILAVINESRNMAMGGNNSDNRSSQEIMEYLPEITLSKIPSKSNSMRNMTLDDNTIPKPKPSFSYRQASGRASPAPSGRRSALDGVVDGDRSPDLFIDDTMRASSERELMDEGTAKDIETGDQEVPMRTRSRNEWPSLPGSSTNSQRAENNDNDKSRTNQRRERWRIDPFNAVVDPNDVPLKPREDNGAEERIPFRFCYERRAWEDPEIREKVMTLITYKLEEAADHLRRSRRTEVIEFQWGSPIKVGSNTRNLDKKTVTSDDSPPRSTITRQNQDFVPRQNMDRNCKRKAAESIRDFINDETESDDSTEDIIDRVKKPKINDKKTQPLSRLNLNRSRQDKMFSNMNAAKSQDPVTIGEYDSDDLDNDDLSSLHLRRDKKVVKSKPPSPDFVPRRIVPPIPGKAKPRRQPKKNGAAKRKSPVRKNAQTTLDVTVVAKGRGKNSKPVTLNDDEIMDELENDPLDADNDDVEIIPKPIKGLARRLQLGTSKLVDTKTAEEEMEKRREEEQQKIKAEENMRKEQIQIQRNLKEMEQRKEREAKEAMIKAKEETYKRREAIRERNRRKEAQEKEAGLLMDDEEIRDAVIRDTDDDEETVKCPICELEFSSREIEHHAAECTQFNQPDKPGRSDANDVAITNEDHIYECMMCSLFTTNDPIAYEVHVNDCKNRNRNGIGSPSSEVIEVSTSPPRYFQPISRQTGSSINYTEQFPNKNLPFNITRRRRN